MNSFKPNQHFIFFLFWIIERQNIFWKKFNGEKYPWTDDDILKNHKFTNVYRVLDRESQFLLKNVIYNEKGLNIDYSSEDYFWRILLFKHFNRGETWSALEKEFGDITLDIRFDDLFKFLADYSSQGNILYSNAYMMTASFMRNSDLAKWGIKPGDAKYVSYFKIYRKELLEDKKIYKLLQSQSLEELYNNWMGITSAASFIAMQYSIDLNYSPLFNFDENSFVSAGLGAIRGIERTFEIEGAADYSEIIKWVQGNLEQLFKENDLEGLFKPLEGRIPTLIDIQNCFCETDKYLRGVGQETGDKNIDGKRIKTKYLENSKEKIQYMLPPKWGIKI